MATWIIGLFVVAAIYFAAKSILKTHKEGGCVGCGDSGKCGGCSCSAKIDLNKK